MKVVVLGAGLVGGPLAIDLAKDENFDVAVVDRDEKQLQAIKSKYSDLTVIQKDLSDPKNVTNLVKEYDFVLNAMPGFMGFKTAEAILRAGKSSVDISFYEEDPFLLDDLAKEMNVTQIMDCGVSPGMNNILIMHAAQQMDEVETVITFVGGLPQIREWPSEYKAVFSPIDVIEEYTRPARYIENGCQIVRPALSDAELINFPGIGTLEAFNTDGLRTLARTIKAKNMKEKTLRYPGHIEKMMVLRELGFFSKERTVEIDGVKIAPLDVTAQVMFPHWKLKKGEGDFTVMKIIVEGSQNRKKIRYEYDLLDRYDRETDTISMARTTGYTATMALRMIAKGLYAEKGISPPEYVGKYPECVSFMLKGLKERGVIYRETIREIL
ncbi:MAG: saccharopine dehydrogenase [Calditrichaeota bacterium]|nr:saccharopine dehydrogenase [Calditrichota bacterium]